jgi:hypothetical protein
MWPWLTGIAVLIGLILFSFYCLGPIISGLLLLVVLAGVIARIISG